MIPVPKRNPERRIEGWVGKGEMASGDIHLLLASRAAADASSPKKRERDLSFPLFYLGPVILGYLRSFPFYVRARLYVGAGTSFFCFPCSFPSF